MKLLTYPDRRLATRCDPFPVDELRDPAKADDWQLVFWDAEKACWHERGLAIAAPQVGIMLRFFVLAPGTSLGVYRSRVYINPVVLDASPESVVLSEGCLSIPGFRAPLRRPARVTIRYHDGGGVERQETCEGQFARVVQHELDHLDGVIFTDHLRGDLVQGGKVARALNKLRGRR